MVITGGSPTLTVIRISDGNAGVREMMDTSDT